jgi:hypothetical protein
MIAWVAPSMNLRMLGNESFDRPRVTVNANDPIARSQSLGDLKTMSPATKRSIDNHQGISGRQLRIQILKPIS